MKSDGTLGMDFTEGKILPLLLKFMLPFLLANLLNNFYNAVDMIVIGHFAGSGGTTAVSLGGKMLNFYTMACMGLSGAGQIMIAQETGAKRKGEQNETIGTLISVLALISVVLAVVTLIFSGGIIRLIHTPESAEAGALAYLRITSIGLPLIFGYESISSVLRGMGDSRSPLLFISIATVMNIILDTVFVVWGQMGVAGTALATVISQGASFLFSILRLYRRRDAFGFDFRRSSFRIVPGKLRILLKLGIPMSLSNGLIQLSQIYVMSCVNTYGVVQAAAYGIGDKILTLANVFISSAQGAGGAVVGQNFGAGKTDRIQKVVYCVMGISMTASAGLTALSLLFPRQIFEIFSTDQGVLAYSGRFMLIAVLLYFLSSIQGSYQIVIMGTGNAKLSFLTGILDGIVLRISFGWLFGEYLGMEVTGYFLGTVLARLAPITISMIYYYSGAWKKHKKLIDTDAA